MACIGEFSADRDRFLEYCDRVGGDCGRVMGEEGVIVTVRDKFPKYVVLFSVSGEDGRFVLVTDGYFVRRDLVGKLDEFDRDDLVREGIKKKLFAYSVSHLIGRYPFVRDVRRVEVVDDVAVDKLPELVRLGVRRVFGVGCD